MFYVSYNINLYNQLDVHLSTILRVLQQNCEDFLMLAPVMWQNMSETY